METGIGGSGSLPKPGFNDVLARYNEDSYPSMVTPIIRGEGQLHMGSSGGDVIAQLSGPLDKRKKGNVLGWLDVGINDGGTTHRQLNDAKGGGANSPGDTTDKEFLGTCTGGRRLNGYGRMGSKGIDSSLGMLGDIGRGEEVVSADCWPCGQRRMSKPHRRCHARPA
ncbi:unnamed protein product [Ilex paraguariensis]|uniref:Uncharacterized protein n=1 Tax=Ilex paraguariensis TaxID=185542 RepID=A0ABC8QYJ4_9AQUA